MFAGPALVVSRSRRRPEFADGEPTVVVAVDGGCQVLEAARRRRKRDIFDRPDVKRSFGTVTAIVMARGGTRKSWRKVASGS
jgi:hypothetical protein